MIKVNNKKIEYKNFPDNTLNIKGNPELIDDDVIISWHYENDSEYMAIAFLTKYYQEHGNKVFLFLPYAPNARMDRTELPEDVFAMKYFGELINSLSFSKVFVVEPHSSVAISSIKNCWVINSDAIVEDIFYQIAEIDGKPIFFFPDEGAMKRYSKKINDVPFAYGIKKRDWKTGEILGLEILGLTADEIKGKNVIIRDDICSKGGTFYYSAKKLKEMGAANIYLFVTHCENSILEGEFGEEKKNLLESGLITKVFTTDSIFTAESNMVFVSNLRIGYTVDKQDDDSCSCENCKCGGEKQ